MVGEEIGERETQLKRKLTPLEKSKVLEETAKLYVVNDGDRLPEFQRRMAERRGFIDVPGQGFVRKNADGPTQPYELPQLDEPDRPHPEPLQPLPEREGQGAQAPAPPRQKRPKMMLDGTPYTPPAPSGPPPLAGGAKEWGFGCPLLAGGQKGSGGPLGARMLPDVKARRTGKFDDWRRYRNGKHNGEDWAAPEGISRAVEEADSDLEAARIAVVVSEDPVAALAMTEGSEYLLPDTAAGLRKKLSGEVERLERQAAAEAEKAAAYAATDALMDRFGTDDRAAWNAMENDPSLDPETRERIWGKYKARLSDRERWEAQRDRDYMSGWMDKIADSSSLEEAQQLIQDSGADGQQRVQMERWAARYTARRSSRRTSGIFPRPSRRS